MELSEFDIMKTTKEALDNHKTSTDFNKIWNRIKLENMRVHSFRKAYMIPLISILTCIFMFSAGFASYQYFNRTVDNTDYPFVDDTNVIGKWKTVDFVERINDFQTGKQSFKAGLYLDELVFVKGGTMLNSLNEGNGNLAFAPTIWTRGKVINKYEKTACAYDVREVDGKTYLFLQWKNGDYVFRGAEPKFYVLEKVDDSDYSDYTAAAKEDRIDYQFENDSQMVGKWESVDFVKEIDQFKPDSKNCLDDLYLTGLELLKNGEIIISATDGYFKTKEVSWTKDIIINKTNKTSSKCTIKEIDGNTYMFFEWKSGDYMYRGLKPHYYVLKKAG